MRNSHTSNSQPIPSATTHVALTHRTSVLLSTAVACFVALLSGSITSHAETEGVNPPVNGVGIVIKKNPGSGAPRVTPNKKGQYEFTVTEAGDYVITLTKLPTDAARTEGTGVKGLKVALGKNPSGAMLAKGVSDDKGNVEFKKLEPGSYFIVMTEAPTKEVPSLPTRKVVPTAPKTEVIPATPAKP